MKAPIELIQSTIAALNQEERSYRQQGDRHHLKLADEVVERRAEFESALGLMEGIVNHAPFVEKAAETPAECEGPAEDPEARAGRLYEAYSAAVGGKNFQGDLLPSWEDFSTDPKKELQANAWRAVALATYPGTVDGLPTALGEAAPDTVAVTAEEKPEA